MDDQIMQTARALSADSSLGEITGQLDRLTNLIEACKDQWHMLADQLGPVLSDLVEPDDAPALASPQLDSALARQLDALADQVMVLETMMSKARARVRI